MSTEQRNPATGAIIGIYPNTSRDQFDAFFVEARRAQQLSWAAVPFKQRAAHIYKMKAYLARHAERVAKIIADCTAKTRQDALATEVLPCLMACDWYAKNTESVLRDHYLPCGNLLFANKSNLLQHCPLGVVGIISPWNYPFSIPFGEIIMGLMAGNAIVLKVATQTVAVGALIEEIVNVGGELPRGLFHHVICGGAQASDWMFKNGVNKIFFTGSVPVGKQLMKDASATLTPLSLELGGNDAMVVCSDANVHRAANCAAWAGFQNAGQSCGGVQRIYVHADIYDSFVQQLCAKTRSLRHGPDTDPAFTVDMGGLTTAKQLEYVVAAVNDAVKNGATVAAQSRPIGDCGTGFFYPATVLTGVKPSMNVSREECFGPVVCVFKVADDAEAIRLANDNTMGLTASVFSECRTHAKAVATRLESGVITVNDHLYTHGASETPWGGWKESGIGRTHGYLGLKEMCNARCINTDMLSGAMMPSNMWWYPFSKATYEGVLNGVRFLAPTSIGQKIGAAMKLVPFALGKMRDAWVVAT